LPVSNSYAISQIHESQAESATTTSASSAETTIMPINSADFIGVTLASKPPSPPSPPPVCARTQFGEKSEKNKYALTAARRELRPRGVNSYNGEVRP